MLFQMHSNTPFMMFLLLTVPVGFVHAAMRFNFENCYSLSGSKCTVSARFLHGFKTCKGCKSLQNRTNGAETRSSKLAMYRKEMTLERNFQKLRESPGVRYESVGRGFESLPSHQENPEHIVFWVFFLCFEPTNSTETPHGGCDELDEPHHLVCNSRQRADSVTGSGASTLVLMAGVRSAGVALVVVMVGAVDFGIKDELSGQIVGHGTVGQAGNAAEQLDAGLHQSDLCARADAAAENDLCAVLDEKADQRTVALPVGRDDLAAQDLTVLDLVELELGRAAKVREDHAVFIRNCDFHFGFSF